MSIKKNIVWLASYPKSGNTWFRAFLSALLSSNNRVDINNLTINHNFANQSFFNFVTELNASELSQSYKDQLKPLVASYLSEINDNQVYIKIHEIFHYLGDKDFSIIPIENTLIVLYFIRNPLDIAVSFAHHNGWTFDRTIRAMNKSIVLNEQKKGTGTYILSEQLGTWSDHVNSWVTNIEIPVHIVRYEDLFTNPLQTFHKAVEAIGLDYSEEKIQKAIESSRFENLQQQEISSCFKEKNPKTELFFRKGKVGTWREELSQIQIKTIIDNHHAVMTKFGYLPDKKIFMSNLSLKSIVQQQNEKLLASDLGDEIVMMNIENGDYIGLNEVGNAIWRLMEQPIQIEKICNELKDVYDVSQENCEKKVLSIIKEMQQEEIVQIIT